MGADNHLTVDVSDQLEDMKEYTVFKSDRYGYHNRVGIVEAKSIDDAIDKAHNQYGNHVFVEESH